MTDVAALLLALAYLSTMTALIYIRVEDLLNALFCAIVGALCLGIGLAWA